MTAFDNFQQFSPFFNDEAMKYFKNLEMPAIDTEAGASMQRKNMDAIVHIQQAFMETMAAFSKAQTQFFQTSLEMAADYAKSMGVNPNKPQEAFATNAKAAQEAADRFTKHRQDLAQMWTTMNEKIMQTLSSRMDECMKETQTISKKAMRT